MTLHDFVGIENALFVVPVFLIGGILMRAMYTSLGNVVLPRADIDPDPGANRGWIAEERRQLEDRRGDERRARARAAYLAGDQSALSEIGRRRCDYDAVGLPFPGDSRV